MIILDVNKLGQDFGYGQLFEDVSFSLNEGESISIVGPNGCGKSTMLKMIAGLEKIDKGTVSIKKDARVAYLDQTGSSIKDSKLVYDVLKDAFAELTSMEKEINRLQGLMESNLDEKEYNRVLEKYCNLVERFSMAGGYDMDVNINTVVEGLQIDRSLLDKSYNDLSGGEKTLVQLAKALLVKPDLLLLDEPTNHIDIPTKEVLEEAIEDFDGTLVFVSHDRFFINKFADKTIEFKDGHVTTYLGNYDDYKEKRNRT